MFDLKEEDVLALISSLVDEPHLTPHFDRIPVSAEELLYLNNLLPPSFEKVEVTTLTFERARKLATFYYTVIQGLY